MIYAFYRFVSAYPTKSRRGFTNWQTKTKKRPVITTSLSNLKKIITNYEKLLSYVNGKEAAASSPLPLNLNEPCARFPTVPVTRQSTTFALPLSFSVCKSPFK